MWYAWFEGYLMPQLRAEAPDMASRLTGTLPGPAPAVPAVAGSDEAAAAAKAAPYPYQAFLASPEVRALMATHFCNNL